MTSQRVLAALYIHPTYTVLFAVVVVGKTTPMGVNVAFQVSVRKVPLSKIRNINLLPFTGVPVGALIVRFAASAV